MENNLLQEAELISNQLRAIRKIIKHSADRDIAQSGLTVPQISVLKALSAQDGQSLKNLSNDLGLSHSTVSGIVDRLERNGLVKRQVDAQDKRITRIYLTGLVTDYLKHHATENQLEPLVNGLRRASESERSAIQDALNILLRLLETHP